VRDLKFASDGATIFAAGRFTNVTGSNSTTPERRESVARLQMGTGNLNPWKIPDGVIGAPQDGWDLVVTREAVVCCRTQLVPNVRGTVKSFRACSP
jgi:hypothetical protein